MPNNIECFDLLTGRIFAALYDEFPLPHQLTNDEFTYFLLGKDPDYPIEPMFDSQRAALEFFTATTQWLISAGYISCQVRFSEGPRAVLTAKGLEALKSVPSSLSGETLGTQLVEAAKAGTVDQLKALAGDAIGMGVRLGVNWISNVT